MATGRGGSGLQTVSVVGTLELVPERTRCLDIREPCSPFRQRLSGLVTAVLLFVFCTGCASWRDYVRSGFKVGPDYCRPPAPVAEHWIDAADVRVRETSRPPYLWWTVFRDPALNDLVTQVSSQNLSLRQAGFRRPSQRSWPPWASR